MKVVRTAKGARIRGDGRSSESVSLASLSALSSSNKDSADSIEAIISFSSQPIKNPERFVWQSRFTIHPIRCQHYFFDAFFCICHTPFGRCDTNNPPHKAASADV